MNIDLRFLDTGKAIRDPIWGYIHVPQNMVPIVDAEEFQRLRDISQLGHVLLVYPGARHSRFEHSLGVFHITGLFLQCLLAASPPMPLEPEDVYVLLAASLLHDIGHYPFSHLLEEMQMFFVDHEERSRQIILDPNTEVHQALLQAGTDPIRVANVIDYRNPNVDIPEKDLRLAHILSGTLDPDKIDYLLRDARYCGVPFGESVNRDRLLSSITFDAISQRPAITYKGISAVEALIFTSYLMYRNVYWHHAVRSANAMFKRGIQDLLHHPGCTLQETDFNRATEADLIHRLEQELEHLGMDHREAMVDRLKRRKLYKVARVVFPHEGDASLLADFETLYYHPDQRRELEIELCRIFGKKTGLDLKGDEILLDIPRFGKSPEVDLKVYFGSHIPIDKADPLSFDDPEVSMLKEYLIGNFEAQARVVRIFCTNNPTLRAALKAGVIEHLKSKPTGQ
ncbi:MAG: HD domain-containing protein [bacterium]|nr:HD domain-containing protein [bacterium]